MTTVTGGQVLVSNLCSIPKAEVVDVHSIDEPFGWGESMQEWIKSSDEDGRLRLKEDWARPFSVVKIIDRTKEQLLFLLDTLPDGRNKWYFREPDVTDPFYIELYHNGEVTATYSRLLEYLLERT